MIEKTLPTPPADVRDVSGVSARSAPVLRTISEQLAAYWPLVKDLQTALLMITGLAGYLSARPGDVTLRRILGLLGSLFLTVGGSTVLNMVIDRDIDAKMSRTQKRPIPSGTVSVAEGLALGIGMVVAGALWALALAPLYGVVVLAGVAFDVLVYTGWLKRRTPWSIIWGGIAGGMPVLAGRVLATQRIDEIGLWLALAVLFWIPTHIMTFSIKYADDYATAGVPVFPHRYGVPTTRAIIGFSTAGAVVAMLWAMYGLDLNEVLMWIARGLGAVLFGFTLLATTAPTERRNFWLYKLASLYMLGSMVVLMAAA
ncbi:MAG: protoheme IX farnesyltransferase [Anaerolineae bacterium]|nr:protoheme IX farnesyltransferase [Anaerolineae bacterium]